MTGICKECGKPFVTPTFIDFRNQAHTTCPDCFFKLRSQTETPEEKEALDRIATNEVSNINGVLEKALMFAAKENPLVDTTNAQFESLSVEVNSEPVWKNGDKCVWNGNDAVFIGYSHSHKSRCAIEYVKDFCSVIDTVFIDSLSKPETPEQKAAREREKKCEIIFERSTGRYWKRADELERDMTEQFLDYIELGGGKLPE